MTCTTCPSRSDRRRRKIEAAALRTQLISRSAECLSRCSDPTNYYFDVVHPTSGFKAICAYGAVLAMSEGNIYLLEQVTKKLAQRAYLQNYEGPWGLLQEFLEKTLTVLEYEDLLFQRFSPCDVFGNILPEIARQMCCVKARPIDPQKGRPVRKKVHRRGYRDKGTLRSVEDHARVSANVLIAVVEGTMRQDRRYDVKHPLLHKEAITEEEVNSLTTLSALEEMYEVATEFLRKEEKLYALQRRGFNARTGVERVAEITAAFIDELRERIERHQSPDLRTQNQEDRTGNETS